MRDEIREKLRIELESCAMGIDEPKVMYILIESRKLLELDGYPDKYKVMRFYCDWVAHPGLDRAGAGTFLQEADAIIARIKQGATKKEIQDQIFELISFQKLASEMRQFCVDYGLPTNISDVTRQRTEFFARYAQIIQNCPLRYEGKKVSLKHIKRLTISTPDMAGFKPEVKDAPIKPFGIKFKIEMTDPDQVVVWQSTFEFSRISLVEVSSR
jgi:hypothetical protein